MQALVEIPRSAQEHLADAFSAFIAAANKLEHSHRSLHSEVARLWRELEERNRALAASLAENERMHITLRRILDALPCGVLVLEVPEIRAVLLNREGRRLLDVPDDRSAEYSLPSWIQETVTGAYQDSLDGSHEQELQLERNGKHIWLAIRYEPISRSSFGSESDQVIVIIRDVTAHKMAEQNREAARSDVALAEVSSLLAHEIRNPLGSMELLVRSLATDPGLNGESKKCLDHLQAGVRLLSATVCNVLRFHSPGPANVCTLQLSSVLRGCIGFVRPIAKQKSVQLALRETLGQTQLAGDPDGLRQVLLNVYCNALRHCTPGSAILTSSWCERREFSESAAVIEVADNGCGIERDDLQHIFEPGFSTTGSSGLGLAVCRRIVEQHRGKITARSAAGEGTAIRVELPIQ